jgi:hypothetical protein
MMPKPDVSAFYDTFRIRNPWLPPAEFVNGKPGVSLEVGVGKLPVLRLELFVELPDMYIDKTVYSFYEPENQTLASPAPEAPQEEAPGDTKKSPEFSTDEVW